MKKSIAAAAAACLAIGLAGPAQAYDRDGYAYAAGHMIGYKDIPKILDAKRTASFSAYDAPGKNFVCEAGDKDVEYPGGKQVFSITYEGRKSSSTNTSIAQFASDNAAMKAFTALEKAVTECAGTDSGSQTFDDGSVDTWQRLTTTGNVPMVTVAGVESIFLNENYEDVTTGPDAGKYSSDNYSVYTLVNDVIIQTSYYTGSELNMTNKQRKAVNQVAFNAVTRWLD